MKKRIMSTVSVAIAVLLVFLSGHANTVEANTIVVADPCLFTLKDGTSLTGTATALDGVVSITDATGKTTAIKESDIVRIEELQANTRVTKTGARPTGSMLLRAFTGVKVAKFDVSIGGAVSNGSNSTSVGMVGLHSRISTNNWRLSNKTDIEFGGDGVDKEQWSCRPNDDIDTDIARFATITDIELRIGQKYFWFLRNNTSRLYDLGIDADMYTVTGGGYYLIDTDSMKLSIRAGMGPHMVWYTGEGDDFGTAVYGGVVFETIITRDLLLHSELDILCGITENEMIDDRSVGARHDTYLQYRLSREQPIFIHVGMANIYRDDVIIGMDELDTRFYAKLVYRF